MTTRAESDIIWEVSRQESYGGYLCLDLLLAAQQPKSDDHDEMLFIVIHQASELWIKLFLHELGAATALIRQDKLDDALKMFARIGRVQQQLIQSWDVLATMTPHDYVRLRPYLGPSSGFQSYQYRQLEFMLGNKDARLIDVHRRDPQHFKILEDTLSAPSLYDEALMLLGRRGFQIPAQYLARNWAEPYVASEEVEQAWLSVYENVDKYWDLYDFCEKLMDVDDRFGQWRYRHLRTVERVIGMKRGTGGSSGVPYLAQALNLRLFPELWSLRTKL